MTSRRDFLTTAAVGVGATALRSEWALASDPPEVKTALNGPVGLQLWSLREQLKKDVPGTLAKVRPLGIREVETAGTWGQTAEGHRAALDKAGLRCQASHMGFERLRDDLAGTLKEAKTLGASWVVCPWIPHDDAKGFTRDDAMKAAVAFNGFAKAGKDEGLKFAYHCHGYEFAPGADGTLFDILAADADPALVQFEVDVFWAKAGGVDPARLIQKYKGRVPFLHVKDMKKGLNLPPGSSGAPDDTNVPLGTGQIDWPAIFHASVKSGTLVYYIEDESPDPLRQIPQSLQYLAGLKL
jgi:sugar phosphate isomerase/epimerase